MKDSKIKLGTDFIDKLLQGGLPRKSIILVEGTSGIGQSVLLYQFLNEGVKNKEKCIYVFSGHMIEEILDEFDSYNLNIKENDIEWIDASGAEEKAIQCDLSELYTVSSAIKKAIEKKGKNQVRLGMDIISPALMSNNPSEVYKFLSSLINDLKKNDVPSILVIEDAMHDPQVVASIEQLCDGVIEMKAIEKDLEIETVMKIKKMRNIPPFQKYFKYRVTEEGIIEKKE
jgi:KaiC/GvpD/RAD55 family RecA-like ATPase